MSRPKSREVAIAFGAVLKLARMGAQLSQERLAELADVDRTTPSLYERGLRQPTIATLICLSRAVGVDPTELVQMTIAHLRREDS